MVVLTKDVPEEKLDLFEFAARGVAEAKTIARTVTNWRQCCVSSFSPITCWDESRDMRRRCGSG